MSQTIQFQSPNIVIDTGGAPINTPATWSTMIGAPIENITDGGSYSIVMTTDAATGPIEGVGPSFYFDGVLNRTDPTGPPGSVWQTWPKRSFVNGNVIRAEWTDSSGQDRYAELVAGNGSGPPPPPNGLTDITAALDAAVGGETIELIDGEYGGWTFTGRVYSAPVTLRSSTGRDAVFASIVINNCRNLHIESVEVHSGGSAVTINSGSTDVVVADCWLHGQSAFDQQSPSWNQCAANSAGVVVNASDAVTVRDNIIHDFHHGINAVLESKSNLWIEGNSFDWIREDDMKLGSVIGCTIRNNTCLVNRVSQGGVDHADCIQFQGSSSQLLIEGNISLPQRQVGNQGIFFDNGTYTDITIRNNVMYTGNIRAISLDDTKSTTTIHGPVLIEFNTCLTPPNETWSSKAAVIIASVASGSIVSQYNVMAHDHYNDGISGTNHTINWSSSPPDSLHYDAYYSNATANNGVGLQLANVAPVPGSPAEATVGAFARIGELLP